MDLIYTKYIKIIAKESQDSDYWRKRLYSFEKSIQFNDSEDLLGYLKEQYNFSSSEIQKTRNILNNGRDFFEFDTNKRYSTDKIWSSYWSFNSDKKYIYDIYSGGGGDFSCWEENGNIFLYTVKYMGMGEVWVQVKFNAEQMERFENMGIAFLYSFTTEIQNTNSDGEYSNWPNR